MNHQFLLTRAFHLHVDLTLYVVITVELLRVRVYLIILADRQIAAQNVQLMLSAQEISLV